MSMRIVTPRGVVKKVDKVYPFAEASTYINNHRKYVFEPANKLQYATGVMLFADNGNFGVERVFTIGNLKNATAKEIIHSLAEKGFYDFSGIEYQDAKVVEDAIIDGGMKPPYCSEFTNVNAIVLSNIGFENTGIFANTFGCRSELPFPNDDDEDLISDEGEEDFTEDGGEESCE